MTNIPDFEPIDPSWIRQRGPVERNIHIRSKHIEPLLFAKKRASWTESLLIWCLFSFLFGGGIITLYAHVLAAQSFYPN